MARAPLRRVLVALAAVTGMAAGMSTVSAAANTSGTTIHFVNQCGAEVAWFDGSSSRALADNASFSTVLAGGDNAAYRAGVTSDATLAEFAVDDAGTTWYDISIIPTGSLGGPGSCSSLEECKQVTGGEGFNVAMRIVPSEIAGSACETLSCLAPACDDAYQYPDEPAKTHSCGAGVEFEVIFCPDGSSSSSSSGSSSSDWVPVASDSQSGSETPLAATKSSAPSAASSTSKSSAAEATGRTTGQDDSNVDSNRSVVIVGVALGVVVVCVLAVALVMRHWRVIVLKWEASQWSLQRNSSPTLSFVKVDDSVQTVSSSSGR